MLFSLGSAASFGQLPMRVAPPVPVVHSAPTIQQINANLITANPPIKPSFEDLFSSGTNNNSGPGWDNSTPPSGFKDLNIFEKNSATVEQVLNNDASNDGLAFTPIADVKNDSSKVHPQNSITEERNGKSSADKEDHNKGFSLDVSYCGYTV